MKEEWVDKVLLRVGVCLVVVLLSMLVAPVAWILVNLAVAVYQMVFDGPVGIRVVAKVCIVIGLAAATVTLFMSDS